jgi:hypothetical protein
MVPVTRALAIRGRLLGIGFAAVLAGCGDPMLPAGYQGPPAGAISASVFQIAPVTKVQRPALSLEWLTNLDALPGSNTLTGQPVRFARSPALQTDWDIGLELPIEGAKLDRPIGPAATDRVRVAVGKMVYFDDQNGDGRLTWSCRGIGCDQPKAVSVEFVVYVDPDARCAFGADPRKRVEGYHYYHFDGGVPREMNAGESVSFLLADRSLAESDPSDELRSFARQLLIDWTRIVTAGCN